MKTNGLLIFTIGLLLAPTSWGDTLKLKDGRIFEGSIIKDTPEEVIFSVEVRPGIKEEKTFKGEEVAVVIPSTVDDKAITIIKGFLPTPDRLNNGDYQKRIDKTQAFLNAFKKSKYRRDAAAILKTLKEEHALVEAGGLKLGDKWLTKEELGSNAYEIDAQIIASDMMRFAAKGPQISALRKFEELRKGYPGSNAYPLAVQAINDVLINYQTAVKADVESFKERTATREKEIGTLNSNQQRATREELQRIADNYAKRLAYEKKTKTKWVSLEPYHLNPMKDTLRNIDRELSSLERFDPSKLKPISETYRTAWAAASVRNRPKVEKLAKDLKGSRVHPKYLKLIEAHILEREAAAEAAGEGAFVEEDEPEEEVAPEEPAMEEPVKEETKKPRRTPRDRSSEADEEERADSSDEESGGILRPIIFGIIGIVILIALFVAFTGKKKSDDE